MKLGALVLRKFRAYLLQNVSMLLLLCVIIVPISMFYFQKVSETLTVRETSALESSTEMLNAEITALESTLSNFCDKADVTLLAYKSEILPPDYILLNDLRLTIAAQSNAHDLVATVITLFSNSSTAVTSDGCFVNSGDATGVDRLARHYGFSESFKHYLSNSSQLTDSIMVFNGSDVWDLPEDSNRNNSFVYCFHPVTKRYVYFFIIVEQADLLQLFSASPGLIELYDLNNRLVSSLLEDTGFDKTSLTQLPAINSQAYSRFRAALYPDLSAQKAILHSTLMTIIMFAAMLILFSLVLATITAYRNCRPLFSILNRLEEYGVTVKGRGELFDQFMSYMEDMHSAQQSSTSTIAAMKQELDNNLIERCLYMPYLLEAGDNPPSIETFPQQYVVCYGVVNATGAPESGDESVELLTLMIGNKLCSGTDSILIRQYGATFVLIIAAESDHDQQLTLLCKQIDSINTTMQITLSVAASHVHVGLAQLNAAYEEARAAMSGRSYESGLHPSGKEALPDDDIAHGAIGDESQFTQAIRSGDAARVSMLIKEALSDKYSFFDLEQRYNYVRSSLLLAQHIFGAAEIAPSPVYSPQYPPHFLNTALNEFAEALCRFVSSRRADAQNIDFEANAGKIMEYVNAHFTDNCLSIPMICEECGVTERTLNNICNVKTGMNISSYIQQLRLDKASSMLRNSDVLVLDILKVCGYNTPNAFYKAFKRAYGKTPSEYRETFR